MICTLQKCDFLCFQPLLSFVPTILCFLSEALSFQVAMGLRPTHRTESRSFVTPAKAGVNTKKPFWGRKPRIVHSNWGSFWVRFSFVLHSPSCAFNNMVASLVLFFVYCADLSLRSSKSRYSREGGNPVLPRMAPCSLASAEDKLRGGDGADFLCAPALAYDRVSTMRPRY